MKNFCIPFSHVKWANTSWYEWQRIGLKWLLHLVSDAFASLLFASFLFLSALCLQSDCCVYSDQFRMDPQCVHTQALSGIWWELSPLPEHPAAVASCWDRKEASGMSDILESLVPGIRCNKYLYGPKFSMTVNGNTIYMYCCVHVFVDNYLLPGYLQKYLQQLYNACYLPVIVCGYLFQKTQEWTFISIVELVLVVCVSLLFSLLWNSFGPLNPVSQFWNAVVVIISNQLILCYGMGTVSLHVGHDFSYSDTSVKI